MVDETGQEEAKHYRNIHFKNMTLPIPEKSPETPTTLSYSPRLLNSGKLLKYQLKDPVVQRQLLVQMLIFFHTLEKPLKSVMISDKQVVYIG